MKQTFSVNIGRRAYNIDDDAYKLLDGYLNDIASRLSEADTDSMDDIEARIADIFDERISSTMQVVNVEMVRRAMAIIGRPDMFGQKRGFSYRDAGNTEGASTVYPPQPKRLYRSEKDKVIGGVCGGLAEYFGIDASVVRIVAVLLLFIPPFPALLAYIIMWIILPKGVNYVKYNG
jgi:phage shock protein PspC (stress-responsive transcriptional regulator)